MTRSFVLALLLTGASSALAQDAVAPAAESDETPSAEVSEVSNADSGDAEPGDAEPGDAEPGDAEPGDAETEVGAADEAPHETTQAVASDAAPPRAASVTPRAKFALLIIGDADAALQSRAAELSQALHDAGLTGVHDGAIHEALLGRGGADDELGPLRRARRIIGLSDDAGARAEALDRIGRATGADALVLLARRPPTLRVYDLGARSFFEAPPSSGEVRYIVRATQAAADRALTSPSLVAEAATEQPDVEVDAEETIPPVRAFFRKNWPYMVGGLLLAGAIVWLVAGSSGNDDTPPPVLRFRPGGTEE